MLCYFVYFQKIHRIETLNVEKVKYNCIEQKIDKIWQYSFVVSLCTVLGALIYMGTSE